MGEPAEQGDVMHKILFGNIFLPVLLLWGVAVAADTSLTAKEREFLQAAMMNGIAQVGLGKLARDKGQEEDVRELGKKLIEDYAQINRELEEIAQSKNQPMPNEVTVTQRADYERLQQLSGKMFDERLKQVLVDSHLTTVERFRAEGAKAKDPEIRRFAGEHLPILEVHLQRAKGL